MQTPTKTTDYTRSKIQGPNHSTCHGKKGSRKSSQAIKLSVVFFPFIVAVDAYLLILIRSRYEAKKPKGQT